MSTTYIPASLRREVISRAHRHCEYCLIHEDDAFFGCEVDHVISEKHGGRTEADNLAFCCAVCNRRKGSDIATLSLDGKLVRLYHPRLDNWSDHFAFDDSTGSIQGITELGVATATILGFNDDDRLEERRVMIELGRFPSPEALRLIKGDRAQ